MAASEAIVQHDGVENDMNNNKKKPPTDSCKRKEPPTETRAPEDGQEGQSQQQQKQQQGTGRKKKPKLSFIYGNYRNYYGYRIDRSAAEDPRLTVFRKEWFEGKDCLDVGCNQGLITIDIAKKFSCRSIVGMDIDKGLIKTACWNLCKAVRMEHASCSLAEASKAHNLKNSNSFEEEVSPASNEKLSKSQSSPVQDFNKRVSFLHENFVQTVDECSEKYDTVLCLSVTKWVHLNWGDEGLIYLFVKIWRLLRPGGILILEPQPWSSYRRNRMASETAMANFHTIQLYPSQFWEILLDKVGFKSAEVITDRLAGTVIGFDRPILVFYK